MTFARSTLQTHQTLIELQEYPPATALFATLTDIVQMFENTTTLSSVFATLTSRVKHKFFVCHSYKKHPGWGALLLTSYPMRIALPLAPRVVEVSDNRERETSRVSSSRDTRYGSRITDRGTPVTNHQSPITKCFAMRTYAKRACKRFRIRTSKTQHFKPFRIRTYKKTPRGRVTPFPFIAALPALCHNHRSCVAARIDNFLVYEEFSNP